MLSNHAKLEVLKNFHVHVYKISMMKEVNVKATDETTAKMEALRLAEKKPLRKADCKYLALVLGENKESYGRKSIL